MVVTQKRPILNEPIFIVIEESGFRGASDLQSHVLAPFGIVRLTSGDRVAELRGRSEHAPGRHLREDSVGGSRWLR